MYDQADHQEQDEMHCADLQNVFAVAVAHGKIIAHTENHHGADGLGKKARAFGENAADANAVQPVSKSRQIQRQTRRTHQKQGGSKHLFDNLACSGIVAGGSGENGYSGIGSDGLGQIQNAHAVGLGGAKEDHKQRNAQHTRFLGTEKLRKVMVRKLFLTGVETPKGRNEHKGQHHQHGADGFSTHIGTEAGIENDTGKAEIHDKFLQTLNFLRCHDCLAPGKDTQKDGHKDWYNDLSDGEDFIHFTAPPEIIPGILPYRNLECNKIFEKQEKAPDFIRCF